DTPARQDFLDALGALLPPPLTRISFGNSGAEAIEAALKFARVATGRIGIIATHRAYHGRTFGALSATADAKYRDPFAPMLEGVRERVPKGSHGSTFAGNPLVCAAAAATLKVLADDTLHTRASSAGTRFQERVRDLGLPQIREIRGRGVMQAVELKKPSTPV